MSQAEFQHDSSPLRLEGNFTVEHGGGIFLERTRIRLLEAIDECGSIAQAARLLPISYKAAWDAVEAMSRVAGRPVVLRTVGGANGGGSRLTDYGRRLVAFYRALEGEYQQAIAALVDHVDDTAPAANFRYLLRRQSLCGRSALAVAPRARADLQQDYDDACHGA